MKRKLLALFLAGVTACGFVAFTGCGGSGDDGSEGPDGSGGAIVDDGTGGGEQNNPAEDTSVKLTGKIYLVGDSTVCSFNDNYYLPRYGYGTQLYNYLNCDANQIVNLALSGRSSLSFLTEGNYNTLKNSISSGDYLIIGFGHNDEKYDDAVRYTNPTKTHTDTTTSDGPSFQYTLYENYVKLAKDKGATPILCTPIVRYDGSNAYSGTTVHSTEKGDYAAAIKTLGTATETAVVDLTTITKELYKGNDNAKYYHAHTSYAGEKPNETPKGIDGTHINMYGAKKIAYELLKALPEGCTLKNHVKTDITSPTYENDYAAAIKKDYVRPPYDGFDENSATAAAVKLCDITTANKVLAEPAQTVTHWYGSAMGNLGGKNNHSKFTKSYQDGTFTVGTQEKQGKIETSSAKNEGAGTDGFGAAFTQIDAKKNFVATAHIKVKSISAEAGSQSGFGMMLRDDIYVNTNDASLNNNYVAAGIIDNKNAIFSREYKETDEFGAVPYLTKENNAVTVAVDSEYDVSVTRLGQAVTVEVKVVANGQTTATFTKTYTDFDFVAVDNDYMYICLFATRGDVVEFTDVTLEITGDAQGA